LFLAHLCTVVAKELGGIHAVNHRAADKGKPVKDHRRLVGVLEEQLLQDIDEDGEGNEAGSANGDLRANALLEVELGHPMVGGILEDAHLW
jgi:hypothetical protein